MGNQSILKSAKVVFEDGFETRFERGAADAVDYECRFEFGTGRERFVDFELFGYGVESYLKIVRLMLSGAKATVHAKEVGGDSAIAAVGAYIMSLEPIKPNFFSLRLRAFDYAVTSTRR